MKELRILRDIPGFRVGVYRVNNGGLKILTKEGGCAYDAEFLVAYGFAEWEENKGQLIKSI